MWITRKNHAIVWTYHEPSGKVLLLLEKTMRKPKTTRFSEAVTFNVPEEMREQLVRLAEARHQTVSGICRQAVLDEITKAGEAA